MEIVGLHALTHDDDHEEECSICVVTTFNKLNPALTPDNPEFLINNSDLIIATKISDSYVFISSKTVETNQLVSRPPPASII